MQKFTSSSSLDEYYDFIAKRGARIAVIVLEDELPFLKESSNHWILSLGHPVFILRASLPDFEILEIGVHPKIIVFDGGDEVADFNGIPTYRQLKAVLK
jgi:hypothetical protein